jgi:hypothetical protein
LNKFSAGHVNASQMSRFVKGLHHLLSKESLVDFLTRILHNDILCSIRLINFTGKGFIFVVFSNETDAKRFHDALDGIHEDRITSSSGLKVCELVYRSTSSTTSSTRHTAEGGRKPSSLEVRGVVKHLLLLSHYIQV